MIRKNNMPQTMQNSLLGNTRTTGGTWGYETRKPYDGEDEYFRNNRHVAGMAADDGKITLNPYSGLSQGEWDAVARNEAARLFMFQKNINPLFGITDQQASTFRGTPYEHSPVHRNQSIMARYLSGDASAGALTDEQALYANWLRRYLDSQ